MGPQQGPGSSGASFQTCNLKAAFCYALLSYRGIGLPGVSSMVYSQALEIRSFCRSPGQKPLVRPEGITKMPFRDFQRPWLSQFASSLGHQIVLKMYSALTGPRKLRSSIPNMQPESGICYALLSYRGIGLPGVSSMVYSQALEIRSFCRSPGQKPLVRPEGITKMPFRDFQRPWLSQCASSLG